MVRRTFQAEGPASVKAGGWGERTNQKFTGVEAEEADESEVCSSDRVSADSTFRMQNRQTSLELEQLCLSLREQECGCRAHATHLAQAELCRQVLLSSFSCEL